MLRADDKSCPVFVKMILPTTDEDDCLCRRGSEKGMDRASAKIYVINAVWKSQELDVQASSRIAPVLKTFRERRVVPHGVLVGVSEAARAKAAKRLMQDGVVSQPAALELVIEPECLRVRRIGEAFDVESAHIPVAAKNRSLRPNQRGTGCGRIPVIRNFLGVEVHHRSDHADAGFEALEEDAPVA